MSQLVFRPEARLELLREVAYYSRARNGAGERFATAIEVAVARAVQHPFSGAPLPGETRRILVKGFPFSIVYRNKPDELLVVAIAPHRRHPLYWIDRLGG